VENEMRLFTVNSGQVSEGAQVGKLVLKGASITIPAIFVGEEGRNRERGVLPVHLLAEQQIEWEANGSTIVRFGTIGQTKSGKPKLFADAQPGSNDSVILVMPTKIGVRGSNSHTGDRKIFPCPNQGKTYEYTFIDRCETCGCDLIENKKDSHRPIHPDVSDVIEYDSFPGKIIVEGKIAEGEAGFAGSGKQYICTMPKNAVFLTYYGGRLYGAPSSHYYVWNGERILVATPDERSATDIF
jgi:hypothetical protein